MPAIINRLPNHVPGTVTRSGADIESHSLSESATFTAFGLPAVINAADGKLRPVAAAADIAKIRGILVFGWGQSASNGFGSPVPTNGTADVLTKGFASVKAVVVSATAAVKGGDVFVSSGVSSANPAGTITTAADGTGSVAITNCTFTGKADSAGSVEVSFNP
jgi:hypothetical protein